MGYLGGSNEYTSAEKESTIEGRGVYFKNLYEESSVLGLNPLPLKVQHHEITEILKKGPAILHVNGNHFVVFEKLVDGKYVKVYNPPYIPYLQDLMTLDTNQAYHILRFQGEKAKSGPEISIKENSILDLGRVAERSAIRKTVEIVNTGDETLKIGALKTSCECTAMIPTLKELLPGQSTKCQLQYNSSSVSVNLGFATTVTMESNDPFFPTGNLLIKGEVDHQLSIFPNPLIFDQIVEGLGTEREVKMAFPHDFIAERCESKHKNNNLDIRCNLEEKKLDVVLKEGAGEGKIYDFVNVYLTDSEEPTLTFEVTGEVVPDLEAFPARLMLKKGQEVRLRIRSRLGHTFEITEIKSGINGLKWENPEGSKSAHELKVVFPEPFEEDTHYIKGVLTISCSINGTIVTREVPVWVM